MVSSRTCWLDGAQPLAAIKPCKQSHHRHRGRAVAAVDRHRGVHRAVVAHQRRDVAVDVDPRIARAPQPCVDRARTADGAQQRVGRLVVAASQREFHQLERGEAHAGTNRGDRALELVRGERHHHRVFAREAVEPAVDAIEEGRGDRDLDRARHRERLVAEHVEAAPRAEVDRSDTDPAAARIGERGNAAGEIDRLHGEARRQRVRHGGGADRRGIIRKGLVESGLEARRLTRERARHRHRKGGKRCVGGEGCEAQALEITTVSDFHASTLNPALWTRD